MSYPRKHNVLPSGQKTPELLKNGNFCLFCMSNTDITRRCHFFCWDCGLDAEVKDFVSFSKFLQGAKYCGWLFGCAGPGCQKGKVFVGLPPSSQIVTLTVRDLFWMQNLL